MRRCFMTAALLMLLGALGAPAQDAWRDGAKELGLFSGGGPAITGGLRDRGFWLAGARFGYQLTADHGGGALRGHLQYGVEAIPFYLQFQSSTVYGAGLTPFLLRYHFTANPRVVPLIELGAGILGTRDAVPEGTSRFNFTPQAGVGVQVMTSSGRGVVFGVRYHHTSNAGIARHNPGINAIMLHVGFSVWK